MIMSHWGDRGAYASLGATGSGRWNVVVGMESGSCKLAEIAHGQVGQWKKGGVEWVVGVLA